MSQTHSASVFHIMAKPAGAICNLKCRYCFFLEKEALYPGSKFRMSDEVLEAYVRQVIESSTIRQPTIAWQGGEPTLMGLEFFRKSIEFEKKYLKPGMTVQNTIQTNGILLDEKWCEFLHQHQFLVGLSLDGPKELHDTYRRDKAGRPVFDKVMHAARLLQQHRVEFNILATVNAANADYPLDVYRFFRDEVEAQFIQFIPVVQRKTGSTLDTDSSGVTEVSVRPQQYGHFLNAIFDEWVIRDVGSVFINHFDAALAAWVGATPGLCTTAPTCGFAMVLEHNGDLYSCDHFVLPEFLLGNIMQTPMAELAVSEKQLQFGRDKKETLPRQCRECEVLFACNGECPKNRFIHQPGDHPLNYLCPGLKSFFLHIDRPMRIMADLLRRRRSPAEIMSLGATQPQNCEMPKPGRNEPCPCGSGLKFKRCHGRK